MPEDPSKLSVPLHATESLQPIRSFLVKQLGLEVVNIKRLDGLANANYLVETHTSRYIFKTYPFEEEMLALVEAENSVLLFLSGLEQKHIPKPLPMQSGNHTIVAEIEGQKLICRLLTYLEGKFLGDIPHTEKLFRSLGTLLACIDKKLLRFTNATLKARQLKWDLQHLRLNKEYLNDIPDVKDRNLAYYFFKQYEENVTPALPLLRRSIIHNDANDWNILVHDDEICGLIDFGDTADTFLINELAIAITYGCFDKDNPLEWASIILNAYHQVLPILEEEINVLYYLIAARLCTTVCNAAHSRREEDQNDYAFVSEKYAWEMLYRWVVIGPVAAELAFRQGAGFPPRSVPSIENLLADRHQHVSNIVSLSYTKPIYMEKAAFQYMYDAYGNTYLDAYNNIPHVGHSHPGVVEAGQRQMAKLNTNTRYLYDQLNAYAESILSKFPDKLNKVFFVNSGSAATDLALRLARAFTGNEKFMVLEHGYHGNTSSGIDVSHYKFNNPKGHGKKDNIIVAPIPDTYRGPYTNNDGSAGKQYAADAIGLIEQSDSSIAAFISEAIVGCGGQVPLAKGYLAHLYPVIRQQGGLCIVDEVQTGFGRVGDHYWAYEEQSVVPDIVILGKPMANGHPMGAVVCTSEIAEVFEKGVEFFSSFGGNPVSCAIGLAVLDIIETEELQQNALIVGDYFKSSMTALKRKYACIGDVRGSGLFLGIDLVQDNSTVPDTKLAQQIKNELRDRHILISTDGPYDNVLKSKPPLRFSKENAGTVVDQIDEILQSHYESKI